MERARPHGNPGVDVVRCILRARSDVVRLRLLVMELSRSIPLGL